MAKHDSFSLAAELTEARNARNENEVRDLLVLIEHVRHGASHTNATLAARNRQSQRRYHRKRRLSPYRVGDMVMVPNGEIWEIGSVGRGVAWRKTGPGEPTSNCPFEQLRPAPRAPVTADARVAACDALYHAVCDWLDTYGDAVNAQGLEAAADAYEKALDGL